MELMSIKQYAETQNVTYEAVRKQIVRYSEELKDHIAKKNRTQYLDEWAVDFLTARRRENPVILMGQDRTEEIEDLTRQVETLKNQLMSAQNELLKEKDKVIELQDDIRQKIEDHTKYTLLLEDNKAKEEKLKEAESQIEDLKKERDEAKAEAEAFTPSIFGFYRKKV